MKIQSTNFLLGIFLILVGIFFLMTSLGKIHITDDYAVSIVFGCAGIVLILANILFHQKLWTLIVGAVFFFIGSAVFIEEARIFPDESIGILLFIIIGLLFLSALRRGKKNWWAIIPGGFSFILAAHIFIETGWRTADEYHGVIFLGGWGLIFGIIYFLKDKTYNLQWAKYPSIILLILAALVLLSVDLNNFVSRLVLPLFLILIGSYIVYKAAHHPILPTEKKDEEKAKSVKKK